MFNSVIEAREAVRQFHFEYATTLDVDVVDQLAAAVIEPSPVDTLVKAIEALHAARETLDRRGLELGRDLVALAAEFGFHGYGGEKSTLVVRDLNESLALVA